MMARRAVVRTASLVLAVALLANCSSDDDADVGAPPAPRDSACAWPTRADRSVTNIAFPDTAATYWALPFALAEGETLELTGSFPDARYASFISYRPTGGEIDVLTDRDIAASPGSTNPFAGDGRADGPHEYAITVRPDLGSDASGNDLGAKVPDGGDDDAPILTPEIEEALDRQLVGSGEELGGSILYRVYTPSDPDDPTGGVGLPAATLIDADGRRTPVPTCPEPGESPAAESLVNQFGPETDRAAPSVPVFIRPDGDQARLYPNPDNVYVATILAHEPGRVVVVRGRAPTFPDTRAGAEVGGGEQVRYWSMCTNEYRKPYPVTDCASDDATALDDDGTYTYVISTPEDRPTNATEADGVTWLAWGSTDVDVVLLLRHMLADGDFVESAIQLEPGELAVEAMGPFAPRGAYCATEEFEADSPACATS